MDEELLNKLKNLSSDELYAYENATYKIERSIDVVGICLIFFGILFIAYPVAGIAIIIMVIILAKVGFGIKQTRMRIRDMINNR